MLGARSLFSWPLTLPLVGDLSGSAIRGFLNPGQCILGVAAWSPVRFRYKDIEVPKPGNHNYFRRIVHYPEKYTIKPIPTTNLAGRDPITGMHCPLLMSSVRILSVVDFIAIKVLNC